MINQLPSQFIASLSIIFMEVQHVEVKIVQQRRKNTVPTPFFHLLKPSTPPLPEIKHLCPFHLAASSPGSQTLLLELEPAERPAEGARTGQPRTQHRGRTLGCSGFEPVDQHPGPQHVRGSIPGCPRLRGRRSRGDRGLRLWAPGDPGRWGRGGDTAPPPSSRVSLPSRRADVPLSPARGELGGAGTGVNRKAEPLMRTLLTVSITLSTAWTPRPHSAHRRGGILVDLPLQAAQILVCVILLFMEA